MPTSKSRLSNVAVSVLLRTGDADVNGVVVVDGFVEVLGDDSGNFGVLFAFGVDIVDGATTDEGDASGVVAATAVGRGGVIVLLLPLSPLAIFFLAWRIAASSPEDDEDVVDSTVTSAFFVVPPLRRAWNTAANSPPPDMMS